MAKYTKNGLNVLIVDDDLAILNAMETGLGKLGYLISRAERASDAIEFIQSDEDFDCIVTDLQLPGSGEKIIQSALNLDHSPPVVVVTGCQDPAKRLRAAQAGAIAVLMKPLTIRSLDVQIRKAANSV